MSDRLHSLLNLPIQSNLARVPGGYPRERRIKTISDFLPGDKLKILVAAGVFIILGDEKPVRELRAEIEVSQINAVGLGGTVNFLASRNLKRAQVVITALPPVDDVGMFPWLDAIR